LGYREGIRWTDIEVENDSMGKPSLSVQRKAKELIQMLRVHQTLLTLSHDRPYAVAHIILEGE
jgi:holo-[acyl-carrier protein] synthase